MGALSGFSIVEFAGIGPVPFCGMLLADMGADMLRIDPVEEAGRGIGLPPRYQVMARGKRTIAIDLKRPRGRELALALVERADALVEGFRPGAMERLGLGPDPCLARNPRLVYGRMTGWGQDGPWAQAAGHDINYIALAGALFPIGERDGDPLPPLNLVGDFGGGALYLCVGVLAALLEASRSGRGQVVDAAIVDGAASLLAPLLGRLSHGSWVERRASNAFDSGAHFYATYRTADGAHVALGAVEAKFYRTLLDVLGLADDADFRDRQMDRSAWPGLKARLAAIFAQRSQAQWCQAFAGRDACFAPVLPPSAARRHPHLHARGTIVERDGVLEPAPAPRFGRTPSAPGDRPAGPGADTDAVLRHMGLGEDEIAALRQERVVA
ncbi:MAG: CaiB/BaiF CoA transferase family protein [Reyranellaceae bacterium]